jgi:hypothetical protein
VLYLPGQCPSLQGVLHDRNRVRFIDCSVSCIQHTAQCMEALITHLFNEENNEKLK